MTRAPEALFAEVVHPEDHPRVSARLREIITEPYEFEYRIIRPDRGGSIAWISDRGFPVRDETGQIIRLAGIATDVTMQKAFEAQVLQAQKLDSIGRIAGGIAHDFNNLLAVVMNQVSMAIRISDSGGRPPREELLQIQEAARQGAEVTRQLLAFARRQSLEPALLDPNDLVDAVGRFLRGALGKPISLNLALHGDIGIVRGDRAQLEQVLVNLALNARDAMADGGTLTIRTRNLVVEEKVTTDAPVPPGKWVMLSVEDTGRGIADADRPHIFEPFFTTKPGRRGYGARPGELLRDREAARRARRGRLHARARNHVQPVFPPGRRGERVPDRRSEDRRQDQLRCADAERGRRHRAVAVADLDVATPSCSARRT